MRIAALAFGILAGLVASLILALGGLGPEGIFGLERQASLVRFGLFVVGNLGIFGAALVLAAPLAGAIMLVVAAVSWIAAAALLRHGFDFVMLTPPAILLVAIVLAVIAHIRRPLAPELDDDEDPESLEDEPELPPPTRRFAYERAVEPRAVAPDFELEFEPDFEAEFEPETEFEPEPEEPEPAEIEVEPLPTTPVRAKFFGLAGTANPSRAAPMPPAAPATTRLRNLLPQTRKPSEDDWSPGRRRPPPPRQQSVFRELETEDEDDEPSGFGRFALGLSNLLNFALYAALAAAALLLLINLRSFTEAPAPAAAPPASSSAAATSAAPPAPAVTAAPAPTLPSMAPAAPILIAPAPTAAEPPPAPVLAAAPEPEPVAAAEPVAAEPPPPSEIPPPASEAPPPEAPPAVAEAPAAAPTPYRMPPAMALARAQPALRAPASAPPVLDTGL